MYRKEALFEDWGTPWDFYLVGQISFFQVAGNPRRAGLCTNREYCNGHLHCGLIDTPFSTCNTDLTHIRFRVNALAMQS